MIKTYYALVKPGIIYGNALTALAGFFLASRGHVNFWLLLAMVVGISFVMASGCVFNNYIDRDIDKVMKRTKNRALVTGEVSGPSSLIFATILGLLGAVVLGFYTNLLTLGIALIGFLVYVVLYAIGKRRSVHGTIVGSIAGAVPPVVGYCAVSNRFDTGALLLFLILVFWQMPHFYAIALYRIDDYAAAIIPVLPAVKGARITKFYILGYIIAFMITVGLLTVFGYTGIIYWVSSTGLGLAWLILCLKGFRKESDDKLWGRHLFRFSLITILILCIMISIGGLLI